VVAGFLSAGAKVTALDINAVKLNNLGNHSNLNKDICDITSGSQLEECFERARGRFGVVACCVALASLDYSVLKHVPSSCDMTPEQFQRTLNINVFGTFLTSRTWLRHIRAHAIPGVTRNVSLILTGSESGHYGERTNPDYAAGKAAVQYGLLPSLKADVPRIFPDGRVNVIAPGPVDTPQFKIECAADALQLWKDSQATSASGKPIPEKAVAKGILFLASENLSGSITGHILDVNGGKYGKLMWLQGEKS
jgi:NAD(P)-dependent dehydrogenase (short-subunit alcohol dehydrogenase family)